MSISKRDNWEFRQAMAAGRAEPGSVPGNTASRTSQTARPLRLQASWDEGAARGSDPYNTVGTRAERANQGSSAPVAIAGR
jgi:hypothetical protein